MRGALFCAVVRGMSQTPTDMSTFYLDPGSRFTLEVTDKRVHDVAIQRWFQQKFLMREGFPVPIVLSNPMDAFATFSRLWNGPNNPYAYLAQLADFGGLDPGPMRFPLFSVDFKRMKYRPQQSYASRTNRRLKWLTVDSAQEGVTINDLANVAQARFPAAWTFQYQVDFWCTRPDTQAIFMKQLTNCFKVMSAGVPQTFIPVVYPNYFGSLAERLVLTSDIDDMTEKDNNNSEVQFRTSFTVEIEGYAIDPSVTVSPTFWTMIVGAEAAISPEDINRYFDLHGIQASQDLRAIRPVLNSVLVSRTPLPPDEPLPS